MSTSDIVKDLTAQLTVNAQPSCNEFVAHPFHSDDQFRPAGVLLEFLTKVVYVHVHSSRECSTVIAPD
jgi:hypothetical protein